MSEHITHMAVLDDCFRLIQISQDVCPDFRSLARTHLDDARLGAITRAGDRHTVQLLTSLRARWPSRRAEDRLEAKLAFALGWLCHRAADRQMKPIFRQLHAQDAHRQNPTEASIYHDIFVLREVYADGQGSPFGPDLFEPGAQPSAQGVNVASLEALVRLLVQRALIGIHTLKPDEHNIEPWLDQLLALRQDFPVQLSRYAQVFSQPDTDKVRRYLTEVNFYDSNDPHIRVARAIQRRNELRESFVSQALHSTSTSQYGQALQRGYSYLQAASDFFTEKISVDLLHERLEINQPGRDNLPV